MENSITGTPGQSRSREQSAARSTGVSTSKLKLVLLWLAVGLPLLWGVMKALEDVGNLPL
jgi:hypothetical protein